MENNNNGRSSYFLYGLSRMTMKVNVYKQNNNNNNNNNDNNNNDNNNNICKTQSPCIDKSDSGDNNNNNNNNNNLFELINLKKFYKVTY